MLTSGGDGSVEASARRGRRKPSWMKRGREGPPPIRNSGRAQKRSGWLRFCNLSLLSQPEPSEAVYSRGSAGGRRRRCGGGGLFRIVN